MEHVLKIFSKKNIKRTGMNTIIHKIGTHLPNCAIDNVSFANRFKHVDIDTDLLYSIFGAESRYIAHSEVQCSDMAVSAIDQILTDKDKPLIDLLIYAAASSDLIEPATSNIIQSKSKLTCPVMDIKNACNSFVTAMHVASAFIGQGTYKNVLVVTGEKLSDTIRFNAVDLESMKSNLAALSFGDAGTAVWLKGAADRDGLVYQSFLTLGEHWRLSTVPGGGSMNPFDVDKNYFHGQTSELINTLKNGKAKDFIQKSIDESPWSKEDIDLVITHQVATPIYTTIAESTGIPIDKIHQVFDKFGNTAAASIPLSLSDAIDHEKAKRGDKILLLGLAAGISVSVQMLIL